LNERENWASALHQGFKNQYCGKDGNTPYTNSNNLIYYFKLIKIALNGLSINL
jgi:hypothetical protein